MTKKRQRGVYLDKEKVRACARSMHIFTVTLLEINYIKHFDIPEEQTVTAPKKAWNGLKMDKKYAMRIAQLLGLPDYVSLLLDSVSSWTSLINNKKYQTSFMDFRLVNNASNYLIDMQHFRQSSYDSLDCVHVKQQWYLVLSGKANDQYMAILQSEDKFFQLAPLALEGCRSVMPNRESKLRYPAIQGFSFGSKEQYGLGWRRCIVIRSSFMPLTAKSHDTGYVLLPRDLDDFALRLMQNKQLDIAIDQYEFMLVDQ